MRLDAIIVYKNTGKSDRDAEAFIFESRIYVENESLFFILQEITK